jgi:hypothetical protein
MDVGAYVALPKDIEEVNPVMALRRLTQTGVELPVMKPLGIYLQGSISIHNR